MKNKSVLALGLVLTMSVSMVGCGSSKKTETEKVNVEVQTPQSGEVTLDASPQSSRSMWCRWYPEPSPR